MCLAVPAQIVKIDGVVAEVDMAGTTVRASPSRFSTNMRRWKP